MQIIVFLNIIPYSDPAKTVDLVAYMPMLTGRMISFVKFKMAAPKVASRSSVLARSEYGILLKNTIICQKIVSFYVFICFNLCIAKANADIVNQRPDFKRAEKITLEIVISESIRRVLLKK